MQMKNQYEPFGENSYYIDKTEALEKGIAGFPSIYIEGAAASGKTTAVRMLLRKHPEVRAVVFRLDEEAENPAAFSEKLRKTEFSDTCSDDRAARQAIWLVFENLNGKLSENMTAEIKKLLHRLLNEGGSGGSALDKSRNRVIVVGRDRPPAEFLDLMWKGQMELIPQKELLFSKGDIVRLTAHSESMLDPEKIYLETGGWAGCVNLMLRMSEKDTTRDVEELRDSYEINTYIRNTILDTLSAKEDEVMRRAAVCPWLDEILCREVWGITYAEDILEMLTRKGLLTYEGGRKRWKIAPLFKKPYQDDKKATEQYRTQGFWKHLGEWYESGGHIAEAAECYQISGDSEQYRRMVVKHYNEIPFLGISYREAAEWKENLPQIIYLRGMYAYFHQDQEQFQKEVRRMQKLEAADRCGKEIYLNLMYVNPEASLDEWMALLETMPREEAPFRLYGILGGSATFLCGLRDLSGLFACTRKEENNKARIWKEHLGEAEWLAYQLARIDYYMETERADALKEEDQKLLDRFEEEKSAAEWEEKQFPWQVRLAALRLLYKNCSAQQEKDLIENIRQLEQTLYHEEVEVCRKNTEAVCSLYALQCGEPERLTHWLRHAEQGHRMRIGEDNYYELACQASGYLKLGQNEKADKILGRIIPFLRSSRRQRYLAEALFCQSIVNWEKGKHGQALQNAIESFLVNGSSRYVGFYADYGNRGKNVIEKYVEWQEANAPEGWHRKKKYNYGSVLRMPVPDYMEVILRCIRREARDTSAFSEDVQGERLTMMEMIVLQDIARGLSNTEICEELNLKLSTVKTHVYSLYKKLGVNSRVQAVIKAKEKGILKGQ